MSPYRLDTPSIGDIETDYGEKEVVITRDGNPDELFVLDGQSGGTCGSGHTHRWHFGADTLLFSERNPARVALADLGGPQGDDHLEMVVSVVSDAVRERLIGRHEAIIASIPIEGHSQEDCSDSLNWTLCSAWLPLEWRWAEKLPDIGPSPVIADIDRDGTLEIILASLDGAVFIWEAGFQSADSTYFCRPKMAWPLKVIDEATTPIVADIDDDDCLEIVIGDESGMVHVYELPGMSACETVTAADIPWPMASANAQRTGDYGTGSSMQEGVVLETHGPGFDLPAPNPFNPVVRLRYQIPYPARVEVAVYDVAGRKVRGLFHGRAEAGAHDLIWDARDEAGRQVASGVYYAVVDMGGSRMTQKLTLLK